MGRIVFWAGAVHVAACLGGVVDVGCHARCCLPVDDVCGGGIWVGGPPPVPTGLIDVVCCV